VLCFRLLRGFSKRQVFLPVLFPAHPDGTLRLGQSRQAYCEVRYSNTCRNMVRQLQNLRRPIEWPNT
jgi:hypothetical protein